MRAAWIAVMGMAVCMHGHAARNAEKCPREHRGLKVVASMESAVLPRGRPARVFITLYNGGEDTVALRPFLIPTFYWLDLEITDAAGRRLDNHGVDYKLIYEETDRVQLSPGYFWGTRIDDLEKSYDIGKPGKYRLRAIYGRGPLMGCARGTIVSEPVTFEVR